ncbi:putative lipid II flippase FtsW [Candidatus Microgenomates bacterium]|nr:putative lipid II flippase FtsW [Candidatus Microgenomates bacterium]
MRSRLFFIPLFIAFIGLFFVFEASSIRALNETGDSFYYFKLQIVWVSIGIFLMTFFSFFNYRRLYALSFPLMAATIASLIFVLIPGIGSSALGARRWIDLGIITFQPTELAKLSMIIYLSSWFATREKGQRFLSFMLLLGFVMALILLQPDMGTTIIVFAISIIIYYLAGEQLLYLILLVPASILGFIFLAHTSPYRLRRLMAFLDPSADPLGVGYHVNQILISLSNGGMLGRGFGASKQKYLFLPEAHTDSIFAIIGEEFGFVGAVLIIFIYGVLIYKMYQIAYLAKDRYSRLLAGGILAYFCLQITINLAGMVTLLPLTGVPLPFISYGGSNLLISFTLMGIMLNIGRSVKSPSTTAGHKHHKAHKKTGLGMSPLTVRAKRTSKRLRKA